MHNGDFIERRNNLEVNNLYVQLFTVYAYKQITFLIFRVDSSAKTNSITHENIRVSSWKLAYPSVS